LFFKFFYLFVHLDDEISVDFVSADGICHEKGVILFRGCDFFTIEFFINGVYQSLALVC
jgi:hypothetical protein